MGSSVTQLVAEVTSRHQIVLAASTPGAGEFLGVDWGSIALVFVVGLIATVVVVSAYSYGIRLLAIGSPDDTESASGGRAAIADAGTRPVLATAGGWACIGIGVVGVLVGIYLVIPQFH
jgi:hypothetical protein